MTDYNKLKVTELKELLKERGIPSTGLSRKNQIVEALEAHDAKAGVDGQGDVGQDEGVAENGGHAAQDEEAIAPEEHALETHATADEATMPTSALPEEVPESQPTEPTLEPAITEVEKNEPVSKEPSALNTPQNASPGAESASSETRKRKRRSPTPPLSRESVSKKLKSAEEELVTLPEDPVVEEAPAPIVDTQDSTTVQPLSVSDDVMEIAKVAPAEDARPPSGSPMDTTAPVAEAEAPQTAAVDAESEELPGLPSTHPATRAIYIRGLVRPLQPPQLRDHIINIASSPPSESAIETFHLDTLRSHAFVVFDSLRAASQARSALHGRIWPDEPSRKELWVDYVPEARVHDWIDEEVATGSRRDAKKWEVVYDTDENGQPIASHQEVTSLPPPPARQSSYSNQPTGPASGPGMPNAPSGPRADRPSTSSQRPPALERTPSQPKPPNATFDVLDQNFDSTTTKPKLYWLPVDKALAEKRLDELAAQTSRSWEDGRAMRDASNIEKQLRRYTFEDRDRVVDNGADIPSFRSEGGRPPGSGRGGRGGGGYRGRR